MDGKNTDKKPRKRNNAQILEAKFLLAEKRKVIADADKKEHQAEVERIKKEKLLGSLIPLKDAQESFLELGSRTKAQFSRLIAELPPKLEGLPASQMIDIIRTSIDEVLSNLFEECSSIADAPELTQEESEDGS